MVYRTTARTRIQEAQINMFAAVLILWWGNTCLKQRNQGEL